MSNLAVNDELELMYEDKIPLNSSKYVQYMQHVKSANRLPFTNFELYYSDDIWDFSKTKKTNTVDSVLKINFKCIPPVFVDDAKFYVLSVLLNNDMKCQSLSSNINMIKNFFKYIYAHGIYSIVDISLDNIKDFLNSKNDLMKRRYIYAIRSFLVFYSVSINKLVYCIIDIRSNNACNISRFMVK